MRTLLFSAGALVSLTLAAQPARDPSIAIQTPVIALLHARVVDGLGHPPRENQSIIIRDGRIAAAGPDAEVIVPADATVRDLAGKTVLPGLVLVHEHLYYSVFAPHAPFHLNEMEYSFPRLYLACGITSMRTGGSIEPYADLQIKRRIDAGQVPGPKLHLTAPYLEGKPAAVAQIDAVDSPEDAARMVNYWADEGFTSFKVYMHLPVAELKAVIAAAHQRHLQVTGHLGAVSYRTAAESGIDNLEHGFFAMSDLNPGWKDNDQPNSIASQKAFAEMNPDSPAVAGLIQLLVDKHVAVTSTLAILETFGPECRIMSTAELETLSAPARENYLSSWAAVHARKRGSEAAAWAKLLELELRFFRAGGLLVAGTDPTGYGGVVAGYGSWRTIELLVSAGLTPVEAIRVATSNGARLLGIDRETGSIVVGKAADLVVVAGNPAAEIADLRKTELVFKDGVAFDSRKLFDSVKASVGIE
ncbi:MAG: amidohydrolase [Verrucomicrobia bacterium]|nr:amidohydrolase [Verrucomicrobiota bacterium]